MFKSEPIITIDQFSPLHVEIPIPDWKDFDFFWYIFAFEAPVGLKIIPDLKWNSQI